LTSLMISLRRFLRRPKIWLASCSSRILGKNLNNKYTLLIFNSTKLLVQYIVGDSCKIASQKLVKLY
jgi:hypothetical protein